MMKNEWVNIEGEIYIYINHKEDRLVTRISRESFNKVNEFPNTWYAQYEPRTDNFYVHGHLYGVEGKRQVTVTLHRWLFDNPEGKVVDHIDHDGLNNKLDNLRVVTHAENLQNRKQPTSANTSGVRGVGLHNGKWRARVTLNGKQIYLGKFDTIEEAEQAVIQGRKEHLKFSTN